MDRRPAAETISPPVTRILPWLIAVSGAMIAGWSLIMVDRRGDWVLLLPFLVAAVAAELLTVQVYEADGQRISLSLTIAVTMAAMTVVPIGTPLVSLLAAIIHVVQRRQRQRAKLLVNLAGPVLAAASGALVYTILSPGTDEFGVWHLLAALAAVLTFYVLNVGIIVLMIALHTGRSVIAVGREATWFGPANIVLGLTGAFVGGTYARLGAIGIVMFIVPLLLLRFMLAVHARKSQEAIATLQEARTRAEGAEARYRGLFEDAADAILATDGDGRLLDANKAAATLLGVTATALRQLHIAELTVHGAPWAESWLASLRESGRWQGEVEVRRSDGTTVPVEWRATVVEEPGACLSISSLRDISERRAVERRLAHQAFHDSLTDLPNRILFMERLEHALIRARRHAGLTAVLFLDLNRFKLINDSFGHDAGDRLLIAIGKRLRASVRPSDLVARLSGDEFTILLEDIEGIDEATRVALRIMTSLNRPFRLDGHDVVISASVGIASRNQGQGRPDELLREADLAMYRAKSRGVGHLEVFDASMNARAMERLELESELRQAIKRGELRVHYQPELELATGKLIGLEALVRWQHPKRGLIAPNAFIPLAEETGLILPLGRWLLAEVCHQAKVWQEHYPSERPLLMSVNFSARQFQHPNVVADIRQILEETGLAPESLMLEITESVLMEEAETNRAVLRQLNEAGVQLAIDDFGTGYSNLAYLKRFQVDMLKIDRTFVAGLGRDPGDSAIVQAIIDLAHNFGVQVIAEGVESAEQAEQLRRLECELGQGYYFAKPLPSQSADLLLARWMRAA